MDEFFRPAREWNSGRFIIAGAQYPPSLRTSRNVERIEHLPPTAHRAFYNRVRFALNVTRGHDRRGLLAERTAVRSCGVRHANRHRQLARSCELLQSETF